MNKEETVRLIECFNSYQGEGPDSGQTMIILRFKTCNKRCSFCDTAVKMRISVEASYELSLIQKTIIETNAGILITGGEPTFGRHFNETLSLLNNIDYPIANVETNGFQLEKLIKKANPFKLIHYIYSPKIFNDKDFQEALELTTNILDNDNVFIKIVYENTPLVVEYLSWLSKKIIITKANKVWLMPEGVTRSDLISNSEGVLNACEEYKFNFSSRNHIIFGFI